MMRDAAQPLVRPAIGAPRPHRSRDAFLAALDRAIVGSRIEFLYPGGARVVGQGPTIDFVVRIHAHDVFDRTMAYGNLGLGESWMDGHVEMEKGRLADLLTLLICSGFQQGLSRDLRLVLRVVWWRLRTTLRGIDANVQSHYDIGDEVFESFLDDAMTYSCGYAETPADSLDTMQRNKFERICRKLRVGPDTRLLDIGCGFGGLLMHAAKEHGARCVGITNSRRHHARGRKRVEQAGLTGRVDIRFGTFEEVDGNFDRVVSVGMLEHVPRSRYTAYFRRITDVLAPDGMGLVHALGCNAAKNTHDPFFQKYIFPGAGQPRLSEMAAQIERRGMAIVDVENMIRHYALTAQHWLARFGANYRTLDHSRYDPRFRRMWEYYLHCGIAAARASDTALYQVLFAKQQWVDMPLRRV